METRSNLAPVRLFGKLLLFDLWAVTFLCHMTVYYCDKFAWKLLGYDKKSRYLRRGGCQRTGLCCQTLGIELPQSWVNSPRVLNFFRGWYALVHNFQSIGPPQGRLLPLACRHLREGNLCSIYPFRPKLCREYPQVSFFGKVELHRGCGFWFVERAKQGQFEESLLQQQHDAERREFQREQATEIDSQPSASTGAQPSQD